MSTGFLRLSRFADQPVSKKIFWNLLFYDLIHHQLALGLSTLFLSLYGSCFAWQIKEDKLLSSDYLKKATNIYSMGFRSLAAAAQDNENTDQFTWFYISLEKVLSIRFS